MAVGAEDACVEVEQLGGDPVEERAVVARRDDDARHLDQRAFEQVEGLVVEVVGGLVEQQARRPAHQGRREGEPGALAAGERGDRSAAVEVGDAEGGGGDLGAAVGVPRVVRDGPGQRPVVLGGGVGVVAARGHPLGEALQGRNGLVQRAQRVVEEAPDAAPGTVGLLRQVDDVVGHLHRPGVGNVPPGEQPEQRGLAGAVLADQADAGAGCGDEVDAVEDGARGEGPDEAAGDEGCGRGGGG